MRGHLAPRDLQLNKIGKRPLRKCFISNLKYLRQVVLKKKISEYFSIYFYGLNLGTPDRGNLGPWDLHLHILGNKLLGNATYQISSI